MDNVEQNPVIEADIIAKLVTQKIIAGDEYIAELIYSSATPMHYKAGDVVVRQGETDNDVYFILDGEVHIIVNGVLLPHTRTAGVTIGEMVTINPAATRSATLIAARPTAMLKVTAKFFIDLMSEFPIMYKELAIDLANRLAQRG